MTLAEAITEALDDLLCGPESDLDHEALAVELADTARRWFADRNADCAKAWEEGARDGGRGLLSESERAKRNPYRGGAA